MTNDESKKVDDEENKLIDEENLKFKSLGYDLKYFHSYQPILKKEFLLAIELNDLDALNSAYKEAKKLIRGGETRGRHADKFKGDSWKEIKSHICALKAIRDNVSYSTAWAATYGTGAFAKPKCSTEDSIRVLLGCAKIDKKTARELKKEGINPEDFSWCDLPKTS